jgi:hypothetical protein
MNGKEDARIFRDARTADERQAEMKNGVMHRMRQSSAGRALGAAYDSPLAKGLVGGLRDAYQTSPRQVLRYCGNKLTV